LFPGQFNDHDASPLFALRFACNARYVFIVTAAILWAVVNAGIAAGADASNGDGMFCGR
jgi:hypothetical protein